MPAAAHKFFNTKWYKKVTVYPHRFCTAIISMSQYKTYIYLKKNFQFHIDYFAFLCIFTDINHIAYLQKLVFCLTKSPNTVSSLLCIIYVAVTFTNNFQRTLLSEPLMFFPLQLPFSKTKQSINYKSSKRNHRKNSARHPEMLCLSSLRSHGCVNALRSLIEMLLIWP